MKRTIQILSILLVVLLQESTVRATPPAQSGQLSVFIDPAYPTVMNGSTFSVRVNLSNINAQGAHCVKIELTATGGFSVYSSKQTILHLTSSKDVEFRVKAPSSSSTGKLSVMVTWSQFYSCGGTMIMNTTSRDIASSTPWKLNFDITKIICMPYANDPAVYTVLDINSWKFNGFTQAKSPYVATINLHPSPSTYNVSLSFPCFVLKGERYIKSITKSVSVSGDSQKISFP